MRIEKPGSLIAIHAERPLDLAVETATIHLMDWLISEHGFSAVDAYCLVSTCPDFRINVYQMCRIRNLRPVAGAEIPKSLLARLDRGPPGRIERSCPSSRNATASVLPARRGTWLFGNLKEFGHDQLGTMTRWAREYGDLVSARFGPQARRVRQSSRPGRGGPGQPESQVHQALSAAADEANAGPGTLDQRG